MLKSIPVTNVTKAPKSIDGRVILSGQTVLAPYDWLHKFGYDDGLHFDFSSFSDNMAATLDGKPVMDLWCPFSAVDGYGRHALDIWRGLKAIGVDVRLRNMGHGVDTTFLPPDVAQAKYEAMYQMPAKVGVAMSVPYDPMLWEHQSLVKIAITQFETSRIPEKHVEAVNRCNHLITTSSFQPPIWRQSGLRIPISVLRPGVDTEFFSYTRRSLRGTFKVLMLGALTERKNPLAAIRIFTEASRGNPDWRLTIKTRKSSGLDEVMKVLGIPEPNVQWSRLTSPAKDPRITLVVGETRPEQIRELYWTHDCFLWPSKGEGVGLPPLEAMATGMELVCADNSGMSDYLDRKWSYPIQTASMEYAGGAHGFGASYVDKFGDVGDWWVPDEKHGVHQLEKCFNDWRTARERGKPTKGDHASEYVRKYHALAHQAASVLQVVEKYL
jgi:glycosyltransferase involved in cell wall biosynthesis